MEFEPYTPSTEAIDVVQDESGLWLIHETTSGRISNELFASQNVAIQAITYGDYSWEQNITSD